MKKYLDQILYEGLGAILFVPIKKFFKNNKVFIRIYSIIYIIIAILIAIILFYFKFPFKFI